MTALPLTADQIAYYRTELENERISYGDLIDIDAVFDLIDPADLPEPAENAMASDKLDEIQERTIRTREGLDALPIGARIVMREGFTLRKIDTAEWVDEGDSMAHDTDEIMGAYADGLSWLPGLVISHNTPTGATEHRVHDDIVDSATIAKMAGVTRSAVSQWKTRHDDFPPELEIPGVINPLYSRRAVQAWLDTRKARR